MVRGKVRKPSEWRKILEGLKTSGLTQKKYAEHIGCHPSNFGWWRKRLKELDGHKPEAATPAFVELRGAEDVHIGPHLDLRDQVHVRSKHGTVITFASLPPLDYIVRILREG